MVFLHLAIILGAIVFVFLLAWFFSAISLHKYKVKMQMKNTKDLALERAFHRFSTWYKSAILWTIAEYVFVIVPFVSNVVVIYLTNTNGNRIDAETILLHSIISLSFIVFGYALNPQRQKKCYRKAFRCLDNSINEYLSALDSSNPNSAILDKGAKEGEDYIDCSYDIK